MHSTYNNEEYENEHKEDVGDEDTIVVDLVPPYGYSPPPKVSTSPAENGKYHDIIPQRIYFRHATTQLYTTERQSPICLS